MALKDKNVLVATARKFRIRRWNKQVHQREVAKELADLCTQEATDDKGNVDGVRARNLFYSKSLEAGLDPATILLLLQLVWKFYQWTKKFNQSEEALELSDFEQRPKFNEAGLPVVEVRPKLDEQGNPIVNKIPLTDPEGNQLVENDEPLFDTHVEMEEVPVMETVVPEGPELGYIEIE
jgi:hypothetical protein